MELRYLNFFFSFKNTTEMGYLNNIYIYVYFLICDLCHFNLFCVNLNHRQLLLIEINKEKVKVLELIVLCDSLLLSFCKLSDGLHVMASIQ